ncbi:MAG: hypothetical protein AAGE59_21690 [Cyanobacteria bacterium P01_F01_bin.86]
MLKSKEISCGIRVCILYPPYVVNQTGVVIGQEEQGRGVKTGYWLIQVEDQDMILALEPHEFEVVTNE